MRMHINITFQIGEQSQINMKAVASCFNSVREINEQNISVAQIAIEPFDSNILGEHLSRKILSVFSKDARGNGSTQVISPVLFFAIASIATRIEKPAPISTIRLGVKCRIKCSTTWHPSG